METRQQNHADWWGRILGLLGLLVGGAALAFVYHTGQITALRDQMLSDFDKHLALQREEFQGNLAQQSKEFNASWDKQLNEALAQFRQDSRQAIQAEELARQARDSAFHQQLETNRNHLVAVLDDPGNLEVAPEGPRLQLAEQTLKPADGSIPDTLVIMNGGRGDARIRRVSFDPTADFRAPKRGEPSDQSDSRDLITLDFQAADNTSQQPGRHGRYERAVNIEDAWIVPGRDNVALKISIENSDHLGWGLIGRLTIDYGTDEPLVIPNARALFQPSTDAGSSTPPDNLNPDKST